MAGDRKFVVHAPIRDLKEFDNLAQQAARLKSLGKVELNISTLASNSRYEMPAGGSPWHDYASRNPTPHKFFPSDKLAPFIPADHVAANRALLLAKVDILRKHGLGAAFWSYEPNFLPEEFFEAYPHLRGPRVDHPRRSNKEVFAACVDQPETCQMLSSSMAQLVGKVPELGTFYFKTNDAGPGLCWADWQYSGPNGPAGCRRKSAGKRVRDLLDAYLSGAASAGKKLTIHFSGNFSAAELDDINSNLPDDCHLRGRSNTSLFISSQIDTSYPCLGLFHPLAIIESLQGWKRPEVTAVFVDFRASYDRAYDIMPIVEKTMEIIQEFVAQPAYGPIAKLQFLHKLCVKWVGADKADKLFDAFLALDDAYKFKRSVLSEYSGQSHGVVLRYINRPLVAMPDRLTPEEENYFLPHVFNPSVHEARMDYIDYQGGRRFLEPVVPGSKSNPRPWIVDTFVEKAESVAAQLESFTGTSVESLLKKTAMSLRIYASLMRSTSNFFGMQVIRDRCAAEFAGPSMRPPKVADWIGSPELQSINAIMRDELDNAAGLVALLQNGGLELLAHAAKPEDEDAFLLGPDIIEQIKRKQKTMRTHWLDAEGYLNSPHK